MSRKVLVSEELFAELGAGRVDWGKADSNGFYTPSVYTAPAILLRDTPEDIERLAAALEAYLAVAGPLESWQTDARDIIERLKVTA